MQGCWGWWVGWSVSTQNSNSLRVTLYCGPHRYYMCVVKGRNVAVAATHGLAYMKRGDSVLVQQREHGGITRAINYAVIVACIERRGEQRSVGYRVSYCTYPVAKVKRIPILSNRWL